MVDRHRLEQAIAAQEGLRGTVPDEVIDAAVRGLRQQLAAMGELQGGAGKSRLLYEFESWLELRPEEVWLLKGRALPSRQHVPLGLMRDVLAERFGLLDSDSTVELAAKIEAGFAGVLSEDNAGLVGRFLGFDLDSGSPVPRAVTAGQLATVARAHLVSWLDRLTADHPAVMLLEDIHWADSESLALVGELITRLPGVPLLVVALTRLDLADRHPEWLGDVHPFRRVDVDRLPAETTALLVREILQHAARVPDELVDLIADRSDGNPFFIEELIKMLADRDVIRTDTAMAGWTIDVDRLGSMGVPATLTAVLQARLDNLAQPDRAVLQSASVVGRVFWDAAVEAIDRRAAEHALNVVRAKELIFRRDHSTFDDCNEFIFKHALLRDVTYETVMLADRQRLHSAAATWLSARAGARMGEFLDTIAEHHRLGGEPALAAACFHRAARTALDRGLAAAALHGVERAIEQWTLVGTIVPPDALVILGDACRRLGDLDGADAALEEAIAQATDPAERSEALMRSSRVASERGDQMLERARLEAASEGADALDARTRARLAALMAWWEHRYGDLDVGRQHGERALAIATAAGAANELLDAHTALGGIAVACDDLDAAETHTRAALELAQDSGDLAAEASGHGNLGVCLHLRADATGSLTHYRTANSHYEQETSLRRALGDRIGYASSVLNAAQVRLRLGDVEGSQSAPVDGLAEAVAVGARRYIHFALLLEADRRLTGGDTDGALSLLGLVRAQPAADRDDRIEIDRVLSRAGLDLRTAGERLAVGATLELDDVVDGLLNGG